MGHNITILGTGKFIPNNKVYNDFFVDHFNELGMKSESLMKHLGRRKRYLASENDTSLSMAYESAKNALTKLELSSEELDMIVFASDTPEYLMPTNALKLTDMLKATNANTVFDMNVNCASMLGAMDVTANYMKAKRNIKKAMVVGSFHISSVARHTDTVVYPNFADASAAIIFESTTDDEITGFLDSETFIDSSYQEHVTLPKCGFSKINFQTIGTEDRKLQWDPFDFSFISDKWATIISAVLERNNLTTQEIDYYVFSQLSDPDNMKTLKKLGVDEEKYFFLGKEYGYTGNTCPILVLDRMWDTIAQKGNKVIFCTVGAGYSIVVILHQF